MADAHLVWSPSAAGSLRQAFGRDVAVTIGNHPSPDLGPLDDGRRRTAFFRDLWHRAGYDPADLFPDDLFDPWREAAGQLAADPPHRVLVWTSASAADHVFLRMAAHFLPQSSLWRVPVPPRDGFNATGIHPAGSLPPLLANAVPLEPAEHARLADEFRTLAARPEPLRRLDANGALTFADISVHDAAILGHCPREWKKAAYAVGTAMMNVDEGNMLSDFFVLSRLHHLAESGLIEIDGDMNGGIHSFSLRRRA